MRYALVENGIVTNVIEAEAGYIPPFGEVIALTDAVGVSEQGMQKQEVGIGWKYEGGTWIAPEIEVEPPSFPTLSPRQLRLALNRLDKLQDLEIIVASLPPQQRKEAEIEWEYATSFKRDHPLIVQFASILGFSEEETDALWMQAAQIGDLG